MEQFNNQFATQNLLQEQQGPFYVVYNKGYGQGKGVANDFKSFPSFEAAQAFADEANNSTSGTFSKFQKYYYVIGSDHEDFEWISQAAHDKAGLDKEIGETLNEVKFTIDDSDLYSAVMDRYMRGAPVQDILIKDEGDYLETDEETFQGIQAIAMDLDKVDALIRLDGIEETSTTSGAGTYLPKATVKKKTDGVKKNKKDVEPKLAAGPADIYMKNKWGWKEAPSIPNRPSKGGFMYEQLFEAFKRNDKLMITRKGRETGPYRIKGVHTYPNGSQLLSIETPKKNQLYLSIGTDGKAKYSTGEEAYIKPHNENYSRFKKEANETEWPSKIPSRYGEYIFKLINVMPDGAKYDVIDAETGKKEPGGKAYRSVETLKNAAADLVKPKGGTQSTQLEENYSRFKKETKTRTNEQQLHTAMRLAEKKIHEANRILEYTAQLKTELNETKVNKNTQKLMEKITRGIAEAYGKMKKLK